MEPSAKLLGTRRRSPKALAKAREKTRIARRFAVAVGRLVTSVPNAGKNRMESASYLGIGILLWVELEGSRWT